MPTLREHLADNGFVGFFGQRRPGDDSGFLLAGQYRRGLSQARFDRRGRYRTGELPSTSAWMNPGEKATSSSGWWSA